MKDIFAILTEKGYEIKDEDKATIKKEVAENYKTIAEFNKKVDEIKSKDDELKSKETAIGDMKKQIETLETDNKSIDDLKSTIKKYEDAENDRKAQAEKDKKIAGLKARFTPLKADKEFFNTYVEDGVFDEFCKALEDESNTGKSDKEIYEAITKDKEIYKNPNTRVNMPSANNGGNKENDAIDKARAIMGLSKKE